METIYIPVGTKAAYEEAWGTGYPFVEKASTALPSTPTINTQSKAIKTIRDGRIVVINDGVVRELSGKIF